MCRECFACGCTANKDRFSRNQWNKGEGKSRCIGCVTKDRWPNKDNKITCKSLQHIAVKSVWQEMILSAVGDNELQEIRSELKGLLKVTKDEENRQMTTYVGEDAKTCKCGNSCHLSFMKYCQSCGYEFCHPCSKRFISNEGCVKCIKSKCYQHGHRRNGSLCYEGTSQCIDCGNFMCTNHAVDIMWIQGNFKRCFRCCGRNWSDEEVEALVLKARVEQG